MKAIALNDGLLNNYEAGDTIEVLRRVGSLFRVRAIGSTLETWANVHDVQCTDCNETYHELNCIL